jgi:hypothetical protein
VISRRPWLASQASSHNVIAEMAMPPDREALRMARLACLDNFAGSVESQTNIWVSSKITVL